MRHIGLIAGRGKIPALLAEEIKKRGYEITAITTFKKQKGILRKYTKDITCFKINEIQPMIRKLKEKGIKECVFGGKVEKRVIFETNFSEREKSLLCDLKDKSDPEIMKLLIHEIESSGIKVVEQGFFLSHLLPKKGVLTKLSPTSNDLQDIDYGFPLAKKLATLSIGQTIIIREKTVLAVEAIEGTDSTILRGGRLGKGNTVAIKVSSEKQDKRFDIPTVGLDTIRTMIKAKTRVLAIEAEEVFVVEKEDVIKLADESGIVIVAV
ncbi:MAG: UDP-2,3-diacylglucosamine diphosphatase LpxI [bacterium]|nr:UDP-2,3-diacylglucosamine diphosphatase LpxI [bacterium]